MKRYWFSILVGTLGFLALDQIAKYLVRSYITAPIKLIGSLLQLDLEFNTGIALSLPLPINLTIGLSFVLIAVVIVLSFSYLPLTDWRNRIGLQLFIGGAVSNFLDRLLFGQVTDYIKVKYFSVFNLGDAFILIGIALIIIFSSPYFNHSTNERKLR